MIEGDTSTRILDSHDVKCALQPQEANEEENSIVPKLNGHTVIVPKKVSIRAYCEDMNLLDFKLDEEIAVVHVTAGTLASNDHLILTADYMQKPSLRDIDDVREALAMEHRMTCDRPQVNDSATPARSAQDAFSPAATPARRLSRAASLTGTPPPKKRRQ